MKIPNWFIKWFRLYSSLGDFQQHVGFYGFNKAESLAWKAYQKGLTDAKKKQ